MGASIQFALNQILHAHVFEAAANPAREVALRKLEKRVDTSGVDESAVELLGTSDMRKEFLYWCDAIGLLLVSGESSGPHFQPVFQHDHIDRAGWGGVDGVEHALRRRRPVMVLFLLEHHGNGGAGELGSEDGAHVVRQETAMSRITPFDGLVSTVFDGLPTSASRSL